MPLFKYYFLFIFLLLGQLISAQNIWPGDVNNNGIVNKVDLLYLGYAHGASGDARTEQSTSWNAQIAPNQWGNNFPNGTNYSFADCNGDGVVDRLDADIILDHLDLKHDDITFVPDEIPLGTEGINPSCEFINAPQAAPVDQVFNLEIALGNMDLPLDSLSGFTFFVNIEPAILGINSTEIKLSTNTWLDGEETTTIFEQKRDVEEVKLEVAYTKIDQLVLNGEGSIAKVSFLIEGDVIDLLVIDTVTFTIDSILVLDNKLTPIPIVPSELKLAVDKEFTVSTVQTNLTSAINLFPNPNKGLLVIESSNAAIENIMLFNAYGRMVLEQKLDKVGLQVVDIQHIPNGMYFAKIETELGILTKKIFKYS
ncbi:MAG: T9SS type A sorting domain-containing protein [Saprospiraceae bacterium]